MTRTAFRATVRTSVRAVAVAAALGLAALPVRADDRAVVQSFYTDVLSKASAPDLAQRAAAVFAPNWASTGDFSGKDSNRDMLVGFLGQFGQLIPDLKWEPVEILQTGNRYVVRSRFSGTPKGPLFGVDGGGKSFTAMSIDVHTVENGKIVRSYHVEDWAGALRQLSAK